jgi:hypothetical protein
VYTARPRISVLSVPPGLIYVFSVPPVRQWTNVHFCSIMHSFVFSEGRPTPGVCFFRWSRVDHLNTEVVVHCSTKGGR